jgi:ABC-type antimicrobial peptide transport system permease subunit
MASGQWTGRLSSPEEQGKNSQPVRIVAVSPRYFETMGIQILTGRPIDAADRAKTAKTVILSATAARNLFGPANPIGRYVSEGNTFDAADAWRVVGVAHDMRFADPRDPFGVLAFIPLMQQEDVPVTTLVLRAKGNGASYAKAIREIVHDIDASRTVGAITRLSDTIDDKLDTDDTVAGLTAAFGVLAMFLTSMGIYAVVGYAVARRTQEIGIRLALGASRGGIARMIIGGLGKLLAVSALAGLAGTLALSRVLHNTLFGIDRLDMAIPIAAAGMLSAVAVMAAYLPARRAARLDPMDALRQD